MKKAEIITYLSIFIVIFSSLIFMFLKFRQNDVPYRYDIKITETKRTENAEKSFIKWAEFNITHDMMKKASEYDIQTKGEISWIDLLAYSASKSYGNINKQSISYIDEAAEKLQKGEDISKDLKYFSFYKEVYNAVLGKFIGKKGKDYGLLAYSPIAKGYSYSHYNDFGASRSFGFNRPHKGNDLLGLVGTPIVAIESGTVEALGWNNYGGWRIGIRSFDKKRYYYYAHLKKDSPFRPYLKEGDEVYAGQVIGYMGMTGYSQKENVNNIETPHLHLGLQLIFDESQKDSDHEIWVDVYQIVKFLYQNRSEVSYNETHKAILEKSEF